MHAIRIDLYSDTKTRPTAAMREAMARAEVGDDQAGEDPTSRRLCERVADLLGQEAALFMPSGTMCNEVALMVHAGPGDEILCHRTAHIVTAETGGPAALSRAMVKPLDGARGMFAAGDVAAAASPPGQHVPGSRVVVVEQTSNFGGGSVWPAETVAAVAEVARARGLTLHMDGARLFNACVASGRAPDEFAGRCDTAWVDFTKGLGAPLGAVLAGSKAFCATAIRFRQMLGGGLRQAGIAAAGCLHALDHHVERLAEDHANARMLAEHIVETPGLSIDPAAVETNIVFFDVDPAVATPADVAGRLASHGVRIGAVGGPHRMRAVTHLDVTRAEVAEAAGALSAVMADLAREPAA